MTDKFAEITLNRELIYDGKIIKVVKDDVLLPNGQEGKRELVFHQGAVAIIAITEDNRLVLVKQFRKALEKSILEIPAGKIEANETSPLETAKRELEEETGFKAEEMNEITSFIASPGFCNEELTIYEAKGLIKVDNPLPQDEDEFLEIVMLTLEEAKEKIKTGEICDAKTMYAMLYWEMNQK